MERTLTRRAFFGVGGAAAAVAAGGLVGCSPAASPDAAEDLSATGAAGAGDYKAAPAPIGDDRIAETLEADVVVVGGGISGAVAAATAAEAAKSVIVLQKAATALSHGSGAAAWNSKAQQDLGVDFDPWEVVTDRKSVV